MPFWNTLTKNLIPCLILLCATSQGLAAEPLDRSFQGCRLGMSPEELRQAAPVVEMKDFYLSLLPGERFFRVKGESLPEGVRQLSCRIYQDRVFKISVEYEQNWLDDEGWDAMLADAMERYGKVPLMQKDLREKIYQNVRWEDSSSIYILRRELRLRFKDKKFLNQSTLYKVYLDKPLWEKRTKAEMDMLF